jgi:hypothetical protein
MGSLVGTVTDQHGAPVPRARVSLYKRGTNDAAMQVRADRAGAFLFAGLPAGTYVLKARQRIVGHAHAQVDLAQGEQQTVTLVLEGVSTTNLEESFMPMLWHDEG